jgi:hypothetical protein
MRRLPLRWSAGRAIALLCLLLLARSAAALDVRVKDVRTKSSAVQTTATQTTAIQTTAIQTTAIQTAIELRDLVPDRFKKTLDEGGVLHLRVQAELWESRPVWDRLVYPAIVRVFRFTRTAASRDLSIADASGAATSYAIVPNPMPVVVELGDSRRITPAERYYVHIIATLGTLAEREVDEVGNAVFGRESETNGLGSLGRLVFRTALQINDYLQSMSAEVKSRKMSGVDVLKRPSP